MNDQEHSTLVGLGSWGMAAGAAFVTFVALLVFGSTGVMGAAFLAAVAFLVLGLIFQIVFVKKLPAPGTVTPGEYTGLRTPIPTDPAAVSVTLKAAQAAAKAEGRPVPTDAREAVSPFLKNPLERAKMSPAVPPVPSAAPAPTAAPAASAAPAAAEGPGTKPSTLSTARDGKPDDLKKIKGVGPKLEEALNEMGFYHYDQIAAWTADEVAWVDENLVQFRGRVSRDDWVSQAKALMKG